MQAVSVVTVLVLASSAFVSCQDQCYVNRYSCTPKKMVSVPRPGPNKYGVYSTRIRGNEQGPLCVLRRRGHYIRPIEIIGTPDKKLIFSPGYEQQKKYVDQMIAEYNIQCDPDESAFLTFKFVDLETRNCYVSGAMKCRDFVRINTGGGAVKEICGEEMLDEGLFIPQGSFNMTLRTSRTKRFRGFVGYVTCFLKDQHLKTSSGLCNSVNPNDIFGQRYQLQEVRPDRYTSLQQRESMMDLETLGDGAPISLTAAEKQVLDALVNPYIDDGLANARSRTPIWPPPEFEDDIEDEPDIDLSDVTFPTPPPTAAPPRDFISPRESGPPGQSGLPGIRGPREAVHKRFASPSPMVRVAVAYQNACNPILKSASKSFIKLAQKINPIALKSTETNLRSEQNALPQAPAV